MKIVFTPRSLLDLEEIADYLKPRSPQGAVRVGSAILGTLQHLTQFPGLGRKQSIDGVRKIGVRRYPYLIYYSVDDKADEIVVLSVQHAARERDISDA
jgi:toxin ParE1/3/4